MELDVFEKSLYQYLDIEPQQWACALLLGEARRASNKARARSADRGESGNRSVDLHGALGELILFGIARKYNDWEAVSYMRDQMFNPNGGRKVEGPDLRFTDGERAIGIDVKTYDCSTRKKFFAINEDKHSELQGKCVGYVGLICPAFAPTACLTRLIPYRHVSSWECRQLRPGESGSPSRNLKIETFMDLYAPQSYDIEKNRRAAYNRREVIAIARAKGAHSMANGLITTIPTIESAVRAAQDSLR